VPIGALIRSFGLHGGDRLEDQRSDQWTFIELAFAWCDALQTHHLASDLTFDEYEAEKAVWNNLQQEIMEQYGKAEVTLHSMLQEFDLCSKAGRSDLRLQFKIVMGNDVKVDASVATQFPILDKQPAQQRLPHHLIERLVVTCGDRCRPQRVRPMRGSNRHKLSRVPILDLDRVRIQPRNSAATDRPFHRSRLRLKVWAVTGGAARCFRSALIASCLPLARIRDANVPRRTIELMPTTSLSWNF
jgi:hypothetical protein